VKAGSRTGLVGFCEKFTMHILEIKAAAMRAPSPAVRTRKEKEMKRLWLFAAIALFYAMPVALAQMPSEEEWTRNIEQWQQRMKAMQKQMDQIAKEQDPEKRRELLAEHWRTMGEQMDEMNMMGGGTMGPGMMGPYMMGPGMMGPGMMGPYMMGPYGAGAMGYGMGQPMMQQRMREPDEKNENMGEDMHERMHENMHGNQ
jgi:hypothetical protein